MGEKKNCYVNRGNILKEVLTIMRSIRNRPNKQQHEKRNTLLALFSFCFYLILFHIFVSVLFTTVNRAHLNILYTWMRVFLNDPKGKSALWKEQVELFLFDQWRSLLLFFVSFHRPKKTEWNFDQNETKSFLVRNHIAASLQVYDHYMFF